MNELFATCSSGLETLLAQELEQLGITKLRRGYGGVYLPKTMQNVYRVNYSSRLTTRLLWPLITFPCKDAKALYEGARRIDWQHYIQPDKSFAIDSHVSHPLLRNSLHAAQVVKDALCDDLREKFGTRPSVDKTAPDLSFHLFIDKGRATISFDTSGAPLYKRGYREQIGGAPIQESLAAALLLQTNYRADKIFCDPFCGSGTFLIEAAMIATRTPSGYFRSHWSFFHFPEFVKKEWIESKEQADQQIIPLAEGTIFGSDCDSQAIALSKKHLEKTGFSQIQLTIKEVKSYLPPIPPNFILCNPPYGKRLELSAHTYTDLFTFIEKTAAPEYEAFFLTPFDSFPSAGNFFLKNQFSFFSGGSKVLLNRVAYDRVNTWPKRPNRQPLKS